MKFRSELLYWGEGLLKQKSGVEEAFVGYELRTVYRNPNVPALEVQFAWLDERHAVAPPMTLESLYLEIRDTKRAVDFYFATFYPSDIRDRARDTCHDMGQVTIDGRIGRHLRFFWPADQVIRSDIYVIPLDPQNTLVVKVRFVQATDEERNIIAPQIVNSIKIDFPPAH